MKQRSMEEKWLRQVKKQAAKQIPREFSDIYKHEIRALIHSIDHWDPTDEAQASSTSACSMLSRKES